MVHDVIAEAFQTITKNTDDFPFWFSEWKTTLIPKPGEFTREANNLLEHYVQMVHIMFIGAHLDQYSLMESREVQEKAVVARWITC